MGDDYNTFSDYTDGSHFYMRRIYTFPLQFWLNLAIYSKHLPSATWMQLHTAQFFKDMDHIAKEALFDSIRANGIDQEFASLMLYGDEKAAHSDIAPVPNMDYTVVTNSHGNDKLNIDRGVGAVIGGQYTSNGKPMLLGSIDGDTYSPGHFYLSAMHFHENGTGPVSTLMGANIEGHGLYTYGTNNHLSWIATPANID